MPEVFPDGASSGLTMLALARARVFPGAIRERRCGLQIRGRYWMLSRTLPQGTSTSPRNTSEINPG
ncbi:hypothetical protein GCM10025874_14170 [Arenivirga flava]|uniref:Uncharacterized protein n=1 Tax=Arenivirga flava TaxID=1930060 RepID=A0AA37UCP5_9MICO|nr:hypothetical protein GCM10025874_14170 [Arenivirga flava]